MKKLLLILLCVPLIGMGQETEYGTFTWGKGPNEGDKYVGEYKDDLMHGQGTYTMADGTVYKGLWENDNFIGE